VSLVTVSAQQRRRTNGCVYNQSVDECRTQTLAECCNVRNLTKNQKSVIDCKIYALVQPRYVYAVHSSRSNTQTNLVRRDNRCVAHRHRYDALPLDWVVWSHVRITLMCALKIPKS